MVDRTSELQSRVEAKKKELERKIAQAKADAKEKGNDTLASLEAKLHEVEAHVKEGWDKLSTAATEKLNNWLKD